MVTKVEALGVYNSTLDDGTICVWVMAPIGGESPTYGLTLEQAEKLCKELRRAIDGVGR